MSNWSFSTGKRKAKGRPSSRVRVYERSGSDRIYMTVAWDRAPSGRPKQKVLPEGTTREQAKKLAEETRLRRELNIIRDQVGEHETPSLGLLLDKYHASQTAEKWGERHAKEQERCKRFWLQELGEHTEVGGLTPSEVEKVAGRAARREEWSARTEQKYLKYLKAAVRWGLRKARLYDDNPIMGLSLPDVNYDTRDRIYSPEEAAKLLTPHEKVDWRVTLAANIACDTGRRLSAIRKLEAGDVKMVEVQVGGGTEERVALDFRAAHDKTGRASTVVVSRETEPLLADALDRKAVKKSGYLLPAGRVGYDEHHDKPVGDSALIGMLHEAESTLEIERVPYRGFHGLKRLHVTLGMEAAGGDASLVGDVTGNVSAELIRNVYRQQDRGRITRQVDAVRGRLEDAKEGRNGAESTRQSTRGNGGPE